MNYRKEGRIVTGYGNKEYVKIHAQNIFAWARMKWGNSWMLQGSQITSGSLLLWRAIQENVNDHSEDFHNDGKTKSVSD